MSMKLKDLLKSIIDNPNIKDIDVNYFDVDDQGDWMGVALGMDSDSKWLDSLEDHLKSLNIERDQSLR